MAEVEHQLVFQQIVRVIGADIDCNVPLLAVDIEIAVQVILRLVPVA